MKIKIPSQTHLILTQTALERDVIPKTENGDNTSFTLSNNVVGIASHGDGSNMIYQMLPIKVEGINYLSALASPTHLFLSVAVEMYELSEQRKSKSFLRCGKKSKDSEISLLNFEKGYTHECYNDYLKARITSIIMLVSALENFMNQQIPNDFSCEVTDYKGKTIRFKNKEEIESGKGYFKIKIEQILPKAIKQEKFWDTKKDDLDILFELYEQRKVFIHLKTKSEEEWQRYSTVFASMIEFDIAKAIGIVVAVMNAIEKNFIELEH